MKLLQLKIIFQSAIALLLAGCASTAPQPASVFPEGFQQDKHLQKVWLASQFDFTGYDTLYVAETKTMLAKTNNAETA